MMTIKTLLAAAALTLAPALATAECGFHSQKQAMSCADGMEYSEDKQSCVPVTG